LAACGGGGGGDGGDGDTASGALAQVTIVDGDGQRATIGQPLPGPLRVRLLSEDGRPMGGQAVSFVVVAGAGSVFAGTATSDASGLAIERWTLGIVAGEQRVEVRSVLGDGQARLWATFSATALPGPPAAIRAAGIVGGAPQAQTLPEPARFVVTDAYGNACPGVEVAFSTPDGGVLQPATARTDAVGLAVTSWTLGRAIGPQTLHARVGELTDSVTGVATQATPGDPVRLVKLLGDFQRTLQHETMGVQLQVQDALGNPVPGVAVRFDVETLPEHLDPVVSVSDASGKAGWDGYVHTAGTQIVRATAAGVPDERFTLEVLPTGEVYDGLYDFQVTLSQEIGRPTTFERRLRNSTWPEYSRPVDTTTGLTRIAIRLSLNDYYELDGRLEFDARGRATGSGSLTYTFGGTPVPGVVGTWTARRR
jgi:hypothetical protein